MSSNVTTTSSGTITTMILGVVAAVLIGARLLNVKLPVIDNDRAALIALLVIGSAICTTGGIGRSFELYGWLHPITLAGIAGGVLILAIALLTMFGVRLPLIANERAAFVAIAGLGFIKVVIMSVGSLFIR